MLLQNQLGIDAVLGEVFAGSHRGLNGKSECGKMPCSFQPTSPVELGHGNKDSALRGQLLLGSFLCFVVGKTRVIGYTQYFSR